MAETPICRDCNQQMIAAKGYHAILAFEPPHDLDSEQFSPVSLFVCGKCGQIRIYAARQDSWTREKVEVVSYGYRVTSQETDPKPAPATDEEEGGDLKYEPRRSKA